MRLFNFPVVSALLPLSLLCLVRSCPDHHPSTPTSIRGGGATFPYPLYDEKWIPKFQLDNPDIRVTYDDLGSEKGQIQFLARGLDFAGSDWPLTLGEATRDGVLHVAIVGGAVVPIYHLKGITSLNFDSETLAGIFGGTIRTWDNQRIAKINPGVRLPPDEINVMHRSDGSGTTMIFTKFLELTTDDWKWGSGYTISWPVGKGVEKNDGVAKAVAGLESSIGYVEWTYAYENNLRYGSVKNLRRDFNYADYGSISRALRMDEYSADPDRVARSILTTRNPDAYPISAITWVLVPRSASDLTAVKKEALSIFLRWVLSDCGQREAPPLGYVRLPPDVIKSQLEDLTQSGYTAKPNCVLQKPGTN